MLAILLKQNQLGHYQSASHMHWLEEGCSFFSFYVAAHAGECVCASLFGKVLNCLVVYTVLSDPALVVLYTVDQY